MIWQVRFRESLFVDFLGALHVHASDEALTDFSRAKLATSLPFLCGLASRSKEAKGQKIVCQLSETLRGSSNTTSNGGAGRSPEAYLKELQSAFLESQLIFLNGVFEGRLRSTTLHPPTGKQIVLALTPLKAHDVVALAYYLDNLDHRKIQLEGLLLQVRLQMSSFQANKL